jgi:hypothetical protein
LFALDGRLLASTFSDIDERRVAAVSSDLPRPDEFDGDSGTEIEFADGTLQLTLLKSHAERPMAWLATARPPAGSGP